MASKNVVLLLVFLILAINIFASQTVRIKLLDYSYRDLQEILPKRFRSQGLATVTVGQTVYLGVEPDGLDIKKYQWELEVSGNNGTRLNETTVENPILIPGKIGQYKLNLTVWDEVGHSYNANMWITAAEYVGNGAIVNMENNAQCIHCHEKKVDDWKHTRHTGAFQRGIEGKLLTGYYRIFCYCCHRTSYSKNSIWEAMDKPEHWHYQEELKRTGLGGLSKDLPQIANLVGVQCESCHGPGSEHQGKLEQNRISRSMNPGVCAICHESPNNDSIPEQWANSPHAGSLDSLKRTNQLNQVGCIKCHTAQGYWQSLASKASKKEDNTESLNGYKELDGLTCAACHDSHAPISNEYMLRSGIVEKACVNCHNVIVKNDESGFSANTQGSVVSGTGGFSFEKNSYPSGKHSQIKKNCVGCHMAKSPNKSWSTVGGHTFRVMADDNEMTTININGCQECHKKMNLKMVRKSQANVKQLMATLADLLPRREEKVDSPQEIPKLPQDPSLNKLQSQASFNYYLVLKDGTYGIHNPVFVSTLLKASIKQLQNHISKITK